MRISLAVLALLPSVALAQEQQAAKPETPPRDFVFEIVAADRETAWRINRSTGEIVVCRIDTTGSLESGPRARCAPAAMENPPQAAGRP